LKASRVSLDFALQGCFFCLLASTLCYLTPLPLVELKLTEG
jgi:hypothetical protein